VIRHGFTFEPGRENCKMMVSPGRPIIIDDACQARDSQSLMREVSPL
jgi:hypothetical protein